MPEVVSAMHLSNGTNVYEPARGNTFRFIVTDLDNLVKPGTGEAIENAQKLLECSVISMSLPFFTQESLTIRRGNSVMHAAGVPTFGEGTLEIQDYIGADGKSILMAWQQLSYNVETDTVGYMSEYKKNCWLVEYDVNYSKIVRQWILYGCWVAGVSQDAYNYTDGGERTCSAQIVYDYAKLVADDTVDE